MCGFSLMHKLHSKELSKYVSYNTEAFCTAVAGRAEADIGPVRFKPSLSKEKDYVRNQRRCDSCCCSCDGGKPSSRYQAS